MIFLMREVELRFKAIEVIIARVVVKFRVIIEVVVLVVAVFAVEFREDFL